MFLFHPKNDDLLERFPQSIKCCFIKISLAVNWATGVIGNKLMNPLNGIIACYLQYENIFDLFLKVSFPVNLDLLLPFMECVLRGFKRSVLQRIYFNLKIQNIF